MPSFTRSICIITTSGPTYVSAMTWHATITDATTGAAVAGAIYVDDVQYCADSACAPITTAEVPVPADGKPHSLRVEAHGYHTWQIEIAGQTKDGRGANQRRPRRHRPGQAQPHRPASARSVADSSLFLVFRGRPMGRPLCFS